MKKLLTLFLILVSVFCFTQEKVFFDVKLKDLKAFWKSPGMKWEKVNFQNAKNGGILIRSVPIHGELTPGTIKITCECNPGRTYRLTIDGDGQLYIGYFLRTAIPFTVQNIQLKGKREILFTVPRKTGSMLRFDIGNDRKNAGELVLRSYKISMLPPQPGEKYPTDRKRLQAEQFPKRLRMVNVSSLTESNAKQLKKIRAMMLRFAFSDAAGLQALKSSMECAAKNGFSFTLEFVPENWEKDQKHLLEMADLAMKAAEPYRKNLIAYGIAIGQKVPNCVKDLEKVILQVRKKYPDIHFLVQPFTAAADYEKGNALNDYKLIYNIPIHSVKDAEKVKPFVCMFPVSVLADRTVSPWECEMFDYGWSIPEKDAQKWARPLHKNGNRVYQEASLIKAVNRVAVPGTLKFIFVTDVHYNGRNFKKFNKEPRTVHMKHIAAMAKKMNVDFLANGGDQIDGVTGRTSAIQFLKASMEVMQTSGRPVFMTIGNHDDCIYTSSRRNDPESKDIVYPEDWFKIVCEPALKAGAVGNPNVKNAKYYYYDHESSKIRTVFLATCENPMTLKPGQGILEYKWWFFGLSGIQMRWFAEKALNFTDKPDPKKWSVFLITHWGPWPMIGGGQFAPLAKAFTEGKHFKGFVKKPLPSNLEFDYSKQGPLRLLAAVHGHTHKDDLEYVCSIPVVTCTKEFNPKSEESWSVFVVNPQTNKLYLFRYGAGYDREIDLK